MQLTSKKKILNCGGKLVDLSFPKVMGILNVTPDSFYDGGRYNTSERIYERVEEIVSSGADIIDVGAVSTRPGAEEIPVKEELLRLEPALEIIRKHYPESIVSVDTYRSEVVREVVQNYGVQIINDISAGKMDPQMHNTVALFNVPYIVMHMQGRPENMQLRPEYEDVTCEIFRFLSEKVKSLKELGVKDIIIDPGFGFGKRPEHNYRLAKDLDIFGFMELPLLVGFSRKSMVYKLLGLPSGESLTGTIVFNTMALMKGADILRVHDVKEAVEAVKIFCEVNGREDSEK